MFTLIPCVSRTHLELCYHFNFSKYMYVLYENKNLSMSRHAYRRWGDKTSYLKNVKCSGEPKNMAASTL